MKTKFEHVWTFVVFLAIGILVLAMFAGCVMVGSYLIIEFVGV